MSWRVLILVGLAAVALFACGPSLPTGSLSDVDAISGGEDLTCAHRRDGSTWCWGDPVLTGGGSSAYAKPILLPGVETASAFGNQVCVVLQDRSVACSEASFGLFNPAWAPVPARALSEESSNLRYAKLGRVSSLEDVAQVAVGVYIDCARRRDGTVACWGDAAEVLRTGTYDRTRPTGARVAMGSLVADVKGLPPITHLSVGDWSALAIGEDGSAWTLGGLARGVERVPGIDDAVEGASGRSFHCVRRKSGDVACWRNGTAAESLGNVASTPQSVAHVAHARKIAAGPWGACALLEDGATACWGGDQHVTQARSASWLTSQQITHARDLQQLVVGAFFACGLDPRGNVMCWGDSRRLGIGFEGTKLAAKIPQTMGYVQLNATGEAIAQAQRNSWFTAGAALLGLALALAWSRRLLGRVTEAWRRLPAAPLVAGAGYRASAVAVNRAHAPRGLRVAMALTLASAGADTAFVVVSDRLMSATGKTAFVLGLLASAGWILVVCASVAAVARGSKRALRRWRPIGAVGLMTHGVFAYLSLTIQYELAWLLAARNYPAPATLALLIHVVQAASLFGVIAAVTMLVASRYHRELP